MTPDAEPQAPSADGGPAPPPSGSDLSFQLGRIVAQICRVMDAEGCTVYLLDEASGEIWSRVLSSTRAPKEIRLKLGEGIAGKVMETGEPLNIRDARTDERHATRFDQSGFVTRSVLCQPLISPDGQRIGVVQVLNKRSPDGFSAADEQLLTALNSQVAIALENARLAEDLAASRAVERTLAAALESKHRELQDSFRRLEATNLELNTNLRRIQQLRLAAAIGGLVLFAAVALLAFAGGGLGRSTGEASAGAAAPPVALPDDGARATLTIATAPNRATLPLQTTIEPLRSVNLVAGLDGRITAIGFRYGQRVRQGDVLLEVDTVAEQIRLREAQVVFIRTRDRLSELERWQSGPAVNEAERTVSRAERARRDAARRAQETERLYGKGIVGRDELDAAQRELESAELDARAAGEARTRALEEGGADNLRIARMEHENTRLAVAAIEARIAAATLRAPSAGVILLPEPREGGVRRDLEVGDEVRAGAILLAIGDLSGLTLRGRLDETEITRVEVGQPAEVTVPALPGVLLKGKIVGRASQGRWDSNAAAYRFDVVATVSDIPAESADRLLLGMSATMDIVFHQNDQAILIPLAALQGGEGERWVEVIDPAGGAPRRQPVRLGLTTLDSVEVLEGLRPGEQIALGPTVRP